MARQRSSYLLQGVAVWRAGAKVKVTPLIPFHQISSALAKFRDEKFVDFQWQAGPSDTLVIFWYVRLKRKMSTLKMVFHFEFN